MSTTTGQAPRSAEEVFNSDQPETTVTEHAARWGVRRRIQFGFENCPSMAEQHAGHLTDVNYLVAKYRPDELAAYLTARSQHRVEILGHDFTQEPTLVQAMQIALDSKKHFENLPENIRENFPNHLAFLKFINDPKNLDRMNRLGLITDEQMKALEPLTTRPIEQKQQEPLLTPDSQLNTTPVK